MMHLLSTTHIFYACIISLVFIGEFILQHEYWVNLSGNYPKFYYKIIRSNEYLALFGSPRVWIKYKLNSIMDVTFNITGWKGQSQLFGWEINALNCCICFTKKQTPFLIRKFCITLHIIIRDCVTKHSQILKFSYLLRDWETQYKLRHWTSFITQKKMVSKILAACVIEHQ